MPRARFDNVGIELTINVCAGAEVLFARFGSGVVDATEAVLDRTPPALTCKTSVTVAAPPELIVPIEQVTVAVPLHEPWEGVAETNEVCAGITSVMVASIAGLGPALLAVIR